jgi:hypothetical protein
VWDEKYILNFCRERATWKTGARRGDRSKADTNNVACDEVGSLQIADERGGGGS